MLDFNEVYNINCLDGFKQLEDESIDLIVTDCPYKIIAGGVRVVEANDECSGVLNKRDYSKTDPKGCLAGGKKVVISDGTVCSNKWIKKNSNIPSAVKDGKMFNHNDIKFSEWLPEVYRVLKQGTHCYIMINSRNLKDLQIEAENVGFIFQNLLIWNKGNATPNKYYMQGAEFILMLRKGAAKNINNMGTTNILSIPNVKNKKHPTQKPVSLLKILIENSSNANDVVLDPFAGSGSTLAAAVNLNRNFLGFELDEEYYTVAKQMIDEASGNVGLFAS